MIKKETFLDMLGIYCRYLSSRGLIVKREIFTTDPEACFSHLTENDLISDHYLKRHTADSYIILDDDPSLFDRGATTPNLYLTSSKTGLTAGDIERIIKNINKR